LSLLGELALVCLPKSSAVELIKILNDSQDNLHLLSSTEVALTAGAGSSKNLGA
jgi:hypothetical protein